MGTRGLTAVVKNGEYKIAQYGQWDHYPSGQGVVALRFLSSKARQKKLYKALDRCKFLTDVELKAGYKSVGVTGDFLTTEQANKFNALYPFLTRDHGAAILELVANSKGPVSLVNQIDFANDSIFCEYAYVVDFDKGTFEVYEGFNKRPVAKKARFTGEPTKGSKDLYYPIRLIKKYKLDKLPTKAEFLKQLKDSD